MNQRDDAFDARRTQLLSTGLDCFLQFGFHGTSTREIARRAGISSGLFFHYFTTKLQLYRELVQIGLAEMELPVREGLADPDGFLCAIAGRVLSMLTDDPTSARMFVFMSYVQAHPEISDEVRESCDQHDPIRASLPVIEAGQRAGIFRDGDPTALAAAFWSCLQGLAEEVAIHPNLPLPQPDWLMGLLRRPGVCDA